MKKPLLLCLAIIGMLTSGCDELLEQMGANNGENSENSGNTDQQQKDGLESIGEELLGYAGLNNWKDSFESFLDFMAILSSDYDTSEINDLLVEAGIYGNKKPIETLPDYIDYGWFCFYRKPSERNYINESETRPSNYNGHYFLDKDKKAWTGERSSTLEVATTVGGERLQLAASIQDSGEKRIVSDYNRYYEDGWPEYKTGPAIHMNQETKEYMMMIDDEGYVLYNCYNPVTGQEYGWIRERDVYENWDVYGSMVTIPGGVQKQTERNTEYLYMPESLEGTFTQGGKSRADIKATLKYTPATSGLVDISKDIFDLDFTFTVGEYTLKSTKLNVLSESANAGYVLSYSGTPVITVNVNETGGSIKKDGGDYTYEQTLEDGTWIYEKVSRTNYQRDSAPERAQIDIDVLGRLQIRGHADIAKILEITNGIDERNESTLKAAAQDLEAAFNLDAFYDGSTERFAFLGLEALPSGESGSLDIVPVIRFADGTSYALFEQFFSENNFSSLFKSISAYRESVNEYITDAINKRITVSAVVTEDAAVWDYGAELHARVQIEGLDMGRRFGFLYSSTAKTVEELRNDGSVLNSYRWWYSTEYGNSERWLVFGANIDDQLEPGTTYYYVPFVDVAGKQFFGDVKTFVSGNYGQGDPDNPGEQDYLHNPYRLGEFVRYYGCAVYDHDHTDINVYGDVFYGEQGWFMVGLFSNWKYCVAIIGNTEYNLEASDGAGWMQWDPRTSWCGKYFWIWAFQNQTVQDALMNASESNPVTIRLTDINDDVYTLVYKEPQRSTEDTPYEYHP